MKIQRLFLRNVRSIKSLDLDFRDPVTGKPMSRIVIAGANGSGKTTILECLYKLLADAGRGIQDDEDNDYRGLMYGDLASVRTRMTLWFQVKLPGQQTDIELPVFLGEQILDSSLKESQRKNTAEFSKLFQAIEHSSKREIEPVGSVLYFPHERRFSHYVSGTLGLELKPYGWAHEYTTNDKWEGSLESYLFSLHYLDLEDRDRKTFSDRFMKTVEIVNSILSDKKISRVEKGRVIVERSDGQSHGLDELSSGEKQVFLMLIEILKWIVPHSVILIDEPEISLHPAWQRALVVALDKIIEQYDAQVIMATHSLDIAGMVMPHEVISLNDLGMPLGKWEPEKELLP